MLLRLGHRSGQFKACERVVTFVTTLFIKMIIHYCTPTLSLFIESSTYEIMTTCFVIYMSKVVTKVTIVVIPLRQSASTYHDS